MSYNFIPKTDEELDSIDLIKEGIYNFEVLKSTRKISKKGNPMAELQLNVWDAEGRSHCIFDYLVFSDINLNIKKVSCFCKAVGLNEEYKKGNIPEELERLSGKLQLGIREAEEKPSGGFYPKKNIVLSYIPNEVEQKSKSIKEEDDFSDDLPF